MTASFVPVRKPGKLPFETHAFHYELEYGSDTLEMHVDAVLEGERVLLIDDWGLETLKPIHRNDLMEIMDDRHEQASTVIISQLPTDQWYASIGDNTFADAILDRLMHNAHRLQLKGESMRKIRATLTEDEHLG